MNQPSPIVANIRVNVIVLVSLWSVCIAGPFFDLCRCAHPSDLAYAGLIVLRRVLGIEDGAGSAPYPGYGEFDFGFGQHRRGGTQMIEPNPDIGECLAKANDILRQNLDINPEVAKLGIRN